MIQIDPIRFPTKHCERCGKTFTKTKKDSAKAWAGKKYCSVKCVNVGRIKKPLVERLLDGIEIVTETGCWIWMGAIDGSGHGKLGTRYKQANARAHRVAYEEFVVKLSPDECVVNKCGILMCCNPYHHAAKVYRRRPVAKIPKNLRTMTGMHVVIDGKRT
ncbi:MAG: hypothetical protein WC236_09730 [Gallionellaceae bacterium]|jgi:hypothetical protein